MSYKKDTPNNASIGLAISLALTIILGLVLYYPYLDQVTHRIHTECMVSDCVRDSFCSWKTLFSCYHFNCTLVSGENETYSKIIHDYAYKLDQCINFTTVECNYDDRNIEESLTISFVFGYLTLLIVISVFLFVSFIETWRCIGTVVSSEDE